MDELISRNKESLIYQHLQLMMNPRFLILPMCTSMKKIVQQFYRNRRQRLKDLKQNLDKVTLTLTSAHFCQIKATTLALITFYSIKYKAMITSRGWSFLKKWRRNKMCLCQLRISGERPLASNQPNVRRVLWD